MIGWTDLGWALPFGVDVEDGAACLQVSLTFSLLEPPALHTPLLSYYSPSPSLRSHSPPLPSRVSIQYPRRKVSLVTICPSVLSPANPLRIGRIVSRKTRVQGRQVAQQVP